MLNCMATYRSTDKKLYDNILTTTATDLSISEGGDVILDSFNRVLENFSSIFETAEAVNLRGYCAMDVPNYNMNHAVEGGYAPLSGN